MGKGCVYNIDSKFCLYVFTMSGMQYMTNKYLWKGGGREGERMEERDRDRERSKSNQYNPKMQSPHTAF